MALLGGPAGSVHAMVATLTAHLNTAIDAVWTAAGTTLTDGNNTVTITKLYPSRIYEHGNREAFLEWPFWIAVQATGGSYSPVQEPYANEMSHTLLLTWAVAADSPQVAEEQISRYQAALFWTLQKYKLLDGTVPGIINTIPGNYQILAAKDAKAGTFVRVGRMQATVVALETTILS